MPEPKPVMLTDAEEDWITRKISTDEPTLNVAPLLHAVEDIVAAREAAARREALLEAAKELDALPSYRSGRGFMYSHETDFADGRDEEAERIADWLRVLAEPERDEEGGR